MKTIISTVLLAMLMVIAIPASAKKHPGDSVCNTAAYANKNSTSKKHFSNVKNAYHPYSKNSSHDANPQRKGFGRPRNDRHLKGKNPNKHSSVKYTSGGFWSFRRHSYSAHL